MDRQELLAIVHKPFQVVILLVSELPQEAVDSVRVSLIYRYFSSERHQIRAVTLNERYFDFQKGNFS